MARLETTDAGWLELRPYGYEIPGTIESAWDDWLLCEWKLRIREHRVRRDTQASFLAWELQSIIAFFAAFEARPRRVRPVKTVEPFVFALRGWSAEGSAWLQLTLDLPVPRPLEVEVSPSAAALFAAELSAECMVLPPRVLTTR